MMMTSSIGTLLSEARERGHDVVLVDTAGRLHIDEALMQELQAAMGDTLDLSNYRFDL